MVLEAKIQSLELTKRRRGPPGGNGRNPGAGGQTDPGNDPGGGANGAGNGTGQGRNRGPRQNRRYGNRSSRNTDYKDLPDFIKNPQAPKDPNETKSWKDQTWHWCGQSTGGSCNRWRQHKGADCRGPGYTPTWARNKNNDGNKNHDSNTSKDGNEGTQSKKRGNQQNTQDNSANQDQNKRTRFHNALEARIRADPEGRHPDLFA